MLFTQRNAPLIVVNKLADLPAAVSGVRTLVANYTYMICGTINLGTDRLIVPTGASIVGNNLNGSVLISNVANNALITSSGNIYINAITLTNTGANGSIISLSNSGLANATIDTVRFTGSARVGTISGYNNIRINACSFTNNANGITFDGAINTCGISNCVSAGNTGTHTFITVAATASFNIRFRTSLSAITVQAGETGYNVSASASIPVEGYILDTNDFTGAGAYLTGTDYSSNKARFSQNKGIINSFQSIFYYETVAAPTTITTPGTYVKAAGTTVASNVSKFIHTNNRATYDGAITRTFRCTVDTTLTSGNNNQVGLAIFVNGLLVTGSDFIITTNGAGRAEAIATQALVTLNNGDFVEVWVTNLTGPNSVTAEKLSVIINAV